MRDRESIQREGTAAFAKSWNDLMSRIASKMDGRESGYPINRKPLRASIAGAE